MNIKIHSNELNQIMKTVSKCINDKMDRFGSIEISHDNNLLTVRGTDGQFSACMSTPLLGGDGEKFCVDGVTFGKVCSMCNGEMDIVADEKFCTIKGNGRTRLPIINADIPAYKSINNGSATVSVKADDFNSAFSKVEHAISNDQSRIHLTGVLIESDGSSLNMTTLDGFRMAIESVHCDGDQLNIIVPGSFMKLIQTGTFADDILKISVDKNKIEVVTDGMKISGGLLSGNFPDVSHLIPVDFKTECLVNSDMVRSALKNSNTLNSKNNLVKAIVEDNKLTIMSNSEIADYDATIDCETQGEGLTIAFNQKYIIDTINSIDTENVIIKMNNPISPCVITGQTEKGIRKGIRLVLPVRIAR